MKRTTEARNDDLRLAVSLLNADPRAAYGILRKLRARALRSGLRDDAAGLLGLMGRAARGYDQATALRVYKKLVRERPERPLSWASLANVEIDVGLAARTSRDAQRSFHLAARHFEKAAELAEASGDVEEAASCRGRRQWVLEHALSKDFPPSP